MQNSRISCTELKDMMSQGGSLIDVRTTREFQQGSIQGAINIPLDQIQGQIHLATEHFSDNSPILLFCRTGARSGMAKRYLEEQGYKDVYNLGSYQHYKSC